MLLMDQLRFHYQVLHSPPTSTGTNQAHNRIHRTAINEPWRRQWRTGCGQRAHMDQFHLDTWNLGWTRMDLGSWNLTAIGLMTLWMGKEPINLGANFLDTT